MDDVVWDSESLVETEKAIEIPGVHTPPTWPDHPIAQNTCSADHTRPLRALTGTTGMGIFNSLHLATEQYQVGWEILSCQKATNDLGIE